MDRTSARLPRRMECLRRAPDSNRILRVRQDIAVIDRLQYACLLQFSCEAF